ncbi:MAG: flagellar biosynthesis protein FliQ [Armatimonadetes bacterium]|nr:flagellar biosynthesis protein FliQ [Armatimonadota bacterium]
MTEADVLEIGRQALQVAISISLPLLGSALIAGLLIAIFQAVTQVQEMTLTFVPKILAIALAFAVFGAWMLSTIVSFAVQSFQAVEHVTQ